MSTDWPWLILLGTMLIAVQSLPTGSGEDSKKSEQILRPKVKRTQELLMFGNQQNHHATENNAGNNFSPSAEKRTLSDSGLEDVSSTITETEQQSASHLKALPSSYVMNPVAIPLHDKSYEYGKVFVNEIEDVLPRGAWEVLPPYGRYYGIGSEDRRKRSEDSSSKPPSASSSTSSSPTIMSSSTASPAVSPAASTPTSKSATGQLKRSLPSYYQEPRYKRESEIDPEEYLALLSFYDNERRNRENWRNYRNEEYENVDDDANMINIDEEDPRRSSWLDNPASYPQQHHYLANDPLLSSDLAVLGRNKPSNYYYDQYLGQQYGATGAQQYEQTGSQYGTPQYGVPYVQHAYYPPEKRFMMNRKRSQNYDSYGDRNGLLLNTRGYLNYKNRLLY